MILFFFESICITIYQAVLQVWSEDPSESGDIPQGVYEVKTIFIILKHFWVCFFHLVDLCTDGARTIVAKSADGLEE